MNRLTLCPGARHLTYAGYFDSESTPRVEGRLDDYRGAEPDRESARRALSQILDEYQAAARGEALDLIAVRAIYGGETFRQPALVNEATRRALEALAHEAPLHHPPLLGLLDAARELAPATPVLLFFETAFFTALPPRERHYALAQDAGISADADAQPPRRFGFHGLFHAPACAAAARELTARGAADECGDKEISDGEANPPARGARRAWRMISVCLEPRPEIAGVTGRRPVFVTSGATPLEGLPGETSCGELDPSAPLLMREKLGWGPERINEALTRESGLKALLGRPARLDEALDSDPGANSPLSKAGDFLRYRALLACGAAAAAMGGVDALVFSGRYVRSGERLGAWLAARLAATQPAGAPAIPVLLYERPLSRILADASAAWWAQHRRPRRAPATTRK